MEFQLSLGIDMSKLTFDYALIDLEGTILVQGQCVNEKRSIRKWMEEMELLEEDIWIRTLVCMEHSGFYSSHLLRILFEEASAKIWLESSLQIKRSSGIQRGKDDALDALRIAAYALDFQRKAMLWKPRKRNLDRLELLVSHRDRLVKNLMSIRTPLAEESAFVDPEAHEEIEVLTTPVLKALEGTIEALENKIRSILKSDAELTRQDEIIRSIPGFGQVISSKLILVTHGFSRINTARKLACYSGVAPFPNRSGTSLRGKTKVSHLANKEIKKMLHMAALVTIRKNNIMHGYYKRKIEEGKNKMLIINAVRNKLLHILMACIRNDTIYEKNYHHSLA